MTREAIIDALLIGANADIWYDAKSFGDDTMEALIERTQQAMIEAAHILEDEYIWGEDADIHMNVSEEDEE